MYRWIFLIVVLLILAKLIYDKLKLYIPPNMPKYMLYDINGNLISNRDWEISEQVALYTHLQENDRVLQLGGNIGGSCITAGKSVRLSRNTCVEPNPDVLPTLRRNTAGLGIEIVDGIITDSKDDMFVVNDNGPNFWGATVTTSKTGKKVNKIPLRSLETSDAYNVLFADCEGCLPSFIREYPSHKWDLVIYEPDQGADYTYVAEHLRDQGMIKIQDRHHCIIWEHPDRKKKRPHLKGLQYKYL